MSISVSEVGTRQWRLTAQEAPYNRRLYPFGSPHQASSIYSCGQCPLRNTRITIDGSIPCTGFHLASDESTSSATRYRDDSLPEELKNKRPLCADDYNK